MSGTMSILLPTLGGAGLVLGTLGLAPASRPDLAGGERPASPGHALLEDRSAAGWCVRDPEVVPLRPTQSAPGSRGSMTLRVPPSPFGIHVDAEGRHPYEVVVQVERLRRRPGATYVAWAATPELDAHVSFGPLPEDGRISGTVSWNKFLVFVSEEPAADVERWRGPIVLTGLSPSGRMHTMAGHGPFEDVNCQQYY